MQKYLLDNREVIIEFSQIGSFVKVSAMDVATLTEKSIQGPASALQSTLEQNALKRLRYVLEKKGIIRA